MKRWTRLLVLGAAATVLVGIIGAYPSVASDAAAITKVGWWSRNPGAQAPADGFAVTRAPDGAVSVAALEVSAFGDLESATLILSEAGGVRQDGAAIQVCTTPNAWKQGTAQAWGEAPKAECEQGAVPMARNATSGTWSADVLRLLSDLDDGPVSLMVVPKASEVPLGFDVQFKAPQIVATEDPDGGNAFDFDTGSSSDGSSSGSFGGGSSGSSGSFGGGTTFDPGPSSFSPAGSLDAPVSGDAAGDTGDATVTADAADDESAAIPFPRTSAQAAAAGGGNRLLQTFFFLVLSTMAAVGATFGRRWVRERQPDAIA